MHLCLHTTCTPSLTCTQFHAPMPTDYILYEVWSGYFSPVTDDNWRANFVLRYYVYHHDFINLAAICTRYLGSLPLAHSAQYSNWLYQLIITMQHNLHYDGVRDNRGKNGEEEAGEEHVYFLCHYFLE